jgi:phosphatidyl-myo-inositol alpha-mannosyltransferase
MKNIKIGLVSSHSFAQPGGVKAHIIGLYNEYKKRGIEVKIIVPRREASEKYGKDVIFLGKSFPINIGGSQGDFDVNFNPMAIESLLKKEKFDVLHFHNFIFPSSFQILLQSDYGCLNILTFHANLDGTSLYKKIPALLYVFRKITDWKIDGVIGVAPLIMEVFEKYNGPKTIIPNGIDLKQFNPKVKPIQKYKDGKINILFLSRIEERKGLIYLLRAYNILQKKFGDKWTEKNLRLIVVGDGPLKGECEKYVAENKLKNIVFEGGSKEGITPSYYKSADIYCAPAIYGESFGIVLIEAMACGIPVAAFANRGYQGVLGLGKGKRFLAKPKDHKTLAKHLETLIKSKKLREEMGKWGQIEAEKYSWVNIADKVLEFYNLCLKQKKDK